MAQQVEHVLGKDEVTGSNPVISSITPQTCSVVFLFVFADVPSHTLGGVRNFVARLHLLWLMVRFARIYSTNRQLLIGLSFLFSLSDSLCSATVA